MRELMAASDSPQVLGIDSRSEGLMLIYTGRVAAARAVGAAQVRESTARGQRGIADIGRAIVAIADLTARDYDSAFTAATTVVQDDPAFTTEVTLPELIEAACRSDRRDEALAALGILSERALAAGTPWALGARSRCVALTETGDRAEAAYQDGIRSPRGDRTARDRRAGHSANAGDDFRPHAAGSPCRWPCGRRRDQ